jgi:hemoglobin
MSRSVGTMVSTFPLLIALLVSGCAGAGRVSRAEPLFDVLGGHSGIERIVDGLLFALVEDPRIGHHFAEANILRLREKLIEQICAESGGPCAYTGDSMRVSHAGRGYRDADFNALVECLQASMNAEQIPFEAQNRLLARLAPMRDEIVEP